MKTGRNIIIVDDNIEFRKNLKTFVEYELNFNITGEASNGIEFLELLSNNNSADIILMDIAMDLMDGFEATLSALRDNSRIKIIAITMHIESIFLLKLVQAGFKGCVFKSNIFDELEKAINKVMSGELYFPKNIKISSDSLSNLKL